MTNIIYMLALMLFPSCEDNVDPSSPATYDLFFEIKLNGKNIFSYDDYNIDSLSYTLDGYTDKYPFTGAISFFDSLLVIQEASSKGFSFRENYGPIFIDFGNTDIDTLLIYGEWNEEILLTDYMEIYYNNVSIKVYDLRDNEKLKRDLISQNQCCPINANKNPLIIEIEKMK